MSQPLLSDAPLWRVRDARRLHEVRVSGLVEAGPRSSLERLAALASTLLEAPYAFVTVVDEALSHYVATAGLDENAPRRGAVEASFCQYVIDDDRELLVGDARETQRTRDNPAIEEMGVIGWAGFPIHLPSGQPLGSFCVVDDVPRSWSDRDREILQTLARSATAEIELWLRLSQERDRRRRAEIIAHASSALGSALTDDAVMTALQSIQWTDLDVDLGALVLIDDADDDSLVVCARWGAHAASGTWDRFPMNIASPVGDAIRTRRAQFAASLEEISSRWPGMYEVATSRTYEAWAAFPIEVGGRPRGGLTVLSRTPRDFREVAAELHELAARLGQALTRASRYEAERSVTMQLQLRLLGNIPERVGELDIASKYVAGTHHLSIGGDFVDVLPISPTRTILVIGDVVGHGLDAAATMARLKGAVRALAPLTSPAVILDRLDDMVDLEPDVFAATMAVVLWDSDAQRLVLACAGHPPPLIRDRNGARFITGGRSAPIGVIDAPSRRPEEVIDVEDDFLLMLYTDGLFERRTLDSSARMDQLRQAFEHDAASGRPDETIHSVYREMIDVDQQRAAGDDIAMLAICRRVDQRSAGCDR